MGKTSLLVKSGGYKAIYFDDLHVRQRAQQDPKLFLDQFKEPILLDEATLVPELFPELKRRVDECKREKLRTLSTRGPGERPLDIWVTGSNQTLLEKNVRESLAGRASYFDLNTLSLHELGSLDLRQNLLRGGWPELYSNLELSPVSYLNDLISTFIEQDIVSAAGIERKAPFASMIGLIAGRIGQLFNATDIAKIVGVDTTTVQSWVAKLEQNAILRTVRP